MIHSYNLSVIISEMVFASDYGWNGMVVRTEEQSSSIQIIILTA